APRSVGGAVKGEREGQGTGGGSDDHEQQHRLSEPAPQVVGGKPPDKNEGTHTSSALSPPTGERQVRRHWPSRCPRRRRRPASGSTDPPSRRPAEQLTRGRPVKAAKQMQEDRLPAAAGTHHG